MELIYGMNKFSAIPSFQVSRLNLNVKEERSMKNYECGRAIPKKVKAVLLLCVVSFASHFLFGVNSINAAKSRRLGCKPILNNDDIRGLSKASHLTDKVVAGKDRALETEYASDPCVVDFPDGVEQYEVDDEIAAGKDEPGFIVADVDLEFEAEPDENGNIILAPEPEEPLDEAEVSCT